MVRLTVQQSLFIAKKRQNDYHCNSIKRNVNKMKTAIQVNYSKLKSTYLSILEFTETEYWKFDEKTTSNSSINFDLGIDGDDADEFLYKFSQKYNVKFEGFIFHRYFVDEGGNLGSFLLFPIFITIIVLQLLFSLLLPESKFKIQNYIDKFSDQSPLTIGDLVASALNGEFIERKNVTFIVE